MGNYIQPVVARIDEIFASLSKVLPALTNLIVLSANLIGFLFVLRALWLLTANSIEHRGVAKPLGYLIGGMLLYNLEAFRNASSQSFFLTQPEAITAYVEFGATNSWAGIWAVTYKIVQVLGVVALIRGILVLRSATSEQAGGGQRTIGSGLVFLCGGIICTNLKQFALMINNTLGLEWNLFS